MRCSSFEALLAGFADGSLPARQATRVAAHLRECSDCRDLLTELKVVDGMLATTPASELPLNFTFAVMAEVRYLRVPPPRRRAPLWAAIAAYVLAAWCLAGLAFYYYGSPNAKAPILQWLHGTSATWLGAGNAVASAWHPDGISAWLLAAAFAIVLIADALALAAILVFYRRLRPQLVAQISTSEGA